MKLRLYLTALSLCLFSAVFSQDNKYTGRIVNSGGAPVEMSSVLYFSNDTTMLGVANADSLGRFEFECPVCPLTLEVRNIGYTSMRFTATRRNLGDIVLPDSLYTLREVVVKGERPLARLERGRLVYDASQLIKGKLITNGFDVIKETPGVMCLDDRNIQLVGATSTTLIVNGKKSVLDAEALTEYLRSLPVELVSKIEVTYNPTPDLHTDGPTINVVLRRSDRQDYSGQFTAGYTNQHANSEFINASGYYDSKTWSLYTMLNFNDSRWLSDGSYEGLHTVKGIPHEIKYNTLSKGNSQSYNFYQNIGYKFGQDKSIDLSYYFHYNPKGRSETHYDNEPFDDSRSKYRNSGHYHDLFLTYTSKNISAGVEYMNYISHSNQDMSEVGQFLDYRAKQNSDKIRGYADFTTPLTKRLTLGYGADYTFNRSTNRQRNIDYANDGKNNYERESVVEDHTLKAYVGLTGSLSDKLMFNAYLREDMYKYYDYEKWTFRPSLNITWYASRDHMFILNANTWKFYPSYWQLQDYVTQSSPYELTMGNPELKPTTQIQTQLIYYLKSKYMFSVAYAYVKNHMMAIPYQSPDTLLLMNKTFNTEYLQTVQFQAGAPVNIGKWYNGYYNFLVFNNRAKADNWFGNSFDRDRWTCELIANHNFTLSTKPYITLNMYTAARTKSYFGVWSYDELFLMNAGLRWQFDKGRATLSLQCNDILESMHHQKLRINLLGQNQVTLQNTKSRNFMLTFTYRLSGYKDKNIRQGDNSRFGISN